MNAEYVVCRLCLNDEPDLESKNGNSTNDDYTNTEDCSEQTVEQLIRQYLPIQIMKAEDSGCPFICSCCISQINQWHRFCLNCIHNDRIYQEQLSEQQVIEEEVFHHEEVMLLKEEMLEVYHDDPEAQDQYLEMKPLDIIESLAVSNSEVCASQEYDPSNSEVQEAKVEESKPKDSPQLKPAPKKRGRPKKDPADDLNLFLRRPCGPRIKQTGEKPAQRLPEMCPICGKFVIVLKEHMRVHIDDRKYQCPHCPKTFVARDNFRRHVNIHTRAKMYKCNQCDKEYTQRNCLKAHLNTHTKDRKYACPVCEKTYYQHTGLARHKRKHFEQPSVKCLECDHMFYSNGEMRQHYRKHLKVRPFPCEICKSAFYRKENLRVHMKIHERKKAALRSVQDASQNSASPMPE